MTDSGEHLRRAQEHLRAADVMLRHGEYPWATVATFYAGMHMIHAGLPSLNNLSVAQQHPESHGGSTHMAEGTNIVVRRYVQDLHVSYKALYSAGVDVRYNGYLTTQAEAQQHRRGDLPCLAQWACRQVHTTDPNCTCWLRSV